MAKWESISVRDAITKIENSEFVLPVIQRRLVWKESEMELLFDTLLKGHSFGAMIGLCEYKATKPLFAFRKFTDDGKNRDSHDADTPLAHDQLFIIDGQQRLQSFYIGLRGSLDGKQMYFDLYSDFFEEEYEFKFAANLDGLPKVNRERTNRSDAVGDCFWYPVKNLYELLSETNDPLDFADGFLTEHGIDDKNKCNAVNRNIQKFYNSVFSVTSIGISTVTVNKNKNETENRQRIVELFRRLNDGGTKLSSWDLVASMFKGFD